MIPILANASFTLSLPLDDFDSKADGTGMSMGQPKYFRGDVSGDVI